MKGLPQMLKYFLATAALVVAGVPAAIGLAGNASFTRDIPVRVPDQAQTTSPASVPTASDDGTDDQGPGEVEPGDDHSAVPGDEATEGADDHGDDAAGEDVGDDHGGDTAGHDAGDDHGGTSGSDDGSATSDDHGGTSGRDGGSGGGDDSGSGSSDSGSSGGGGSDDGSGHN
jgi:hypothetical protein